MGNPPSQDALAIFREACRLAPGSRSGYLDRVCGGDLELRAEVDSMLAWDVAEDAMETTDPPPSGVRAALEDLAASAEAKAEESAPLPAAIGGYRIVRLIANGGMATVYEAKQEHPDRSVAIKVAHVRRTGSESARRFELEAQLLARLCHPAIAQIIEAGVTEAGSGARPYLVMEFVEGQTLTDYAAAHLQTTRQKLALMVRVCEAVGFAHEHGVIHRDLKPDNVLVGVQGVPKILDFGVAKVAAAGGFGAATLRTEAGRIIGTMGYMSPEQLAGQTAGLGPTADVFSLGVMTFELLAGRLPHDVDTVSPTAALAALTMKDALRLSAVDREFRGDIEAIVAMALERDPADRYADALALGSDLERHLNGQAVRARRHSLLQRARRLWRRRRGALVGIAAAFATLLLGFIAALWFGDRPRDDMSDEEVAKLSKSVSWFERWIDFEKPEHRVRADNIENFPSTALTVEFWVRVPVERPMIDKAALFSYAAPDEQNEVLLDDTTNLRAILDRTVTGTSGINLCDNQWHHVAFTWDKSSGILAWYHNGYQVRRWRLDGVGALEPNGTLVLAEDQDAVSGDQEGRGRGYSTAQALIGSMAEVRVWSDVRTSEEIVTYWNRRLIGTESDLALYWRMDALESLGIGTPGENDVRDLSAHGNHGDAENGVALGGR